MAMTLSERGGALNLDVLPDDAVIVYDPVTLEVLVVRWRPVVMQVPDGYTAVLARDARQQQLELWVRTS